MKPLFYLNKFFWKYRKLLLIGTFFIVVANLFALYPAEFVRKAFDAVLLSMKEGTNTEQGVKDTLLKYGGLLVSFSGVIPLGSCSFYVYCAWVRCSRALPARFLVSVPDENGKPGRNCNSD